MPSSSPTNPEKQEVRVRYAPSPTGYLHVGGARTVLFNWLFAKATNGKFILRIEDTDQARSTRQSEQLHIEDIRGLGLIYDEGPDIGGPFGPYRQSERLSFYAQYAKELLDLNRAYFCFCSDELLTQKRETAMKLGKVPQYDGTCRDLPKEEALMRKQAGEKATVRFKAPVKEYKLQDAVRGEVIFQPQMVGDFVLLRNDGMPVYNFCCVVDDHLMKISHVLRAEEHLSNTVRQMMLYETFNWPMPVFAHCSLIVGADKQKLSKRHGDTSVHEYIQEGFLKEALLNFLILLGWSAPDNKEILNIQEMIERFSLKRLHKPPCVFDLKKLEWMNGQYIRSLPLSEITERALPFLKELPIESVPPEDLRDANPTKTHEDLQDANPTKTHEDLRDANPTQYKEWLEKAFDTIRGQLIKLKDAPRYLSFYFNETFKIDEEAKKICQEPHFALVVKAFKAELELIIQNPVKNLYNEEDFTTLQESVKFKTGVMGKNLFMPIRIAMTGQTHGPELKLVFPLLGVKKIFERVKKILGE